MYPQTTQHRVLEALAKKTADSEKAATRPVHLHRATHLWAELQASAHTVPRPEHLATTCARVAQCSGAVLEIHAGVERQLEMLKNASKTDPERVDRALAQFVGLSASEYFAAGLLTLFIEAERARAEGAVLSASISNKVVEALEQNALGASVEVYPNFEEALFRDIPFQTALRIIHVTNSPQTRTHLLDKIYPDTVQGPDILLTEHVHALNAKEAVQSMDGEAILAWLDAAPAGPLKEKACILIVKALAELGRLHDIPECLAHINCPRKQTTTAAEAAVALARQDDVFGARRLLEHVEDPQARVPCEVEIVVSDLSTLRDLPAAVEELNRIEFELVGPRAELLREWEERRPVLEGGALTFPTMRALSRGWRAVGERFFEAGCMNEALETWHRIPLTSPREGLWSYFLEKIPHSTAPEELLSFIERALELVELRARREPELAFLRTIIPVLAKSGNRGLLDRAFELIDDKFADSAPSTCAERRDEAIARFFVTPPNLRDSHDADTLCGSISNPNRRGETQQLLALWAAFEGDEVLCAQRLRAAEASLHAAAVANPTNQKKFEGLEARDANEPKTPLPDLIAFLQTMDASALSAAEAAAWFAKAAEMALSLASHQACGIFVLALRLADMQPFPSREAIFERLLARLRDLYFHAPHDNLFYPEIRGHLQEKGSDAYTEILAVILESIDWQRSFWDDFFQEPPPSQSPATTQERDAFRALLTRFSRGFDTDGLLKNVFEAAVPHALHIPNPPLVNAFFDAVAHLNSAESKIAITQCVLLFAPNSKDPVMLEQAAERFADEGGFLQKVREAVTAEKRRIIDRASFGEYIPFEDRIAGVDFETALEMVSALPSALEREKYITPLLQRALDMGDQDRFAKVFELAEQTFVESASKDTAEFTTWEAKPWFDVLRQIPDDGSRLSLLNRTWDWFGLVPFPYKNPLLVTWAEQMASLGHASRALDVVREIPTAEDRALAFFKISLAVGLLRGEPRAAEIFSWIPQTVDEAVQQNDSCFRVLAEASEAFARAGDMDRFHGIHALGRRVLTSMARHFQTGSVLSGLLSSLVVANLAEPWLDLVAFTASHAGIDSDMFRYFLEDLEKMNFAQSMCFTTTQRSAALRHLLAFSKRMKMRPSYEAKIFQLCASGCTDLLPLKETFREASSCHPDLISALLGNPWEKAREDRPTPALTTCDLPWLASLCPYSAEATVSIIGHAVADALAREDWSGIHRITLECGPVPLKELQRLAEAVLASRAA